MKIRNSSVSASVDKKDGKHYANIFITILTDEGHTRDIEMDIPTPIEDWEKADYHGSVVNKYRGKDKYINKASDGK